MRLTQLWITDFRNYEAAEVELPPGLTVVVGDNGAGKTNLLEAVGYLATLESFRGVPGEALVRQGTERAVVRGTGLREGRELLIEAEIRVRGRGRVAVNRQPLRRTADLVDALAATVFSPDDLDLVKGGPSSRRRYLDDLLVSLHRRNDALRRDLERILRQRTALLRDAGGRLSPALAPTLDVWDAKLAAVGDALGAARADLVARLEPALAAAYAGIAGPDARPVAVAYEAPWRVLGLAAALEASRTEELRRGVCLVGPHRDELVLTLAAMPARTHASQGEQRSLALALRLAGHRVVGEALGEPPVLLLDDVFSELDDSRSQALLDHLPPGQAILTTTGAIPTQTNPELVVEVTAATLRPHPGPHVPSPVSVAPGPLSTPNATQTAPPKPAPPVLGGTGSPPAPNSPPTGLHPGPPPVRGADSSPGDENAPRNADATPILASPEPVRGASSSPGDQNAPRTANATPIPATPGTPEPVRGAESSPGDQFAPRNGSPAPLIPERSA